MKKKIRRFSIAFSIVTFVIVTLVMVSPTFLTQAKVFAWSEGALITGEVTADAKVCDIAGQIHVFTDIVLMNEAECATACQNRCDAHGCDYDRSDFVLYSCRCYCKEDGTP